MPGSGNMAAPKPFLKWAGGKRQLIGEIDGIFEAIFSRFGPDFTYIEPFVGGGAILFHILSKFSPKSVIINDINVHLIDAYNAVKYNCKTLLEFLSQIERQYYQRKTEADKKKFYLQQRCLFNRLATNNCQSVIRKTALLLFLNKTCYNGLYRVNKKGEFNVPFGRYKNPKICDRENLNIVHKYLENVTIISGDFAQTIHYAKKPTVFYLDPPYIPLSVTSCFTSYSSEEFNLDQQMRLKKFCDAIQASGNYFILSNSDSKYLYELYQDYNIKRVKARRSINSKGDKRGAIFELLITNF